MVMHVTRREVLAAAAAATAMTTLPRAGWTATSMQVGAYKITTVSDGFLQLPEHFTAPGADEKSRRALLGDLVSADNFVRSPLNVTVVQGASETVLIDAGSGERFVPTAGQLVEGLDAIGIAPDDVTKVILTHAHPDHLWGVIDGFDELTFLNAEHVINGAEMDFWLAPDVLSRLPDDQQAFAVGAQRHLAGIGEQLTRAKPGDAVAPGIELIDTAGHTPGHVSVSVSDGDARTLILGDALAHPIISFAHPDWRPRMDLLGDQAAAMRARLLAELASDQTPIVGYHLTAPGAGYVRAAAGAYRFESL